MIVASLFGELAESQNLQATIDNSIDALYTQAFWRQYLDWGLPQTELTFATIIGRKKMQAAASLVDPDSPAPLRSRGFFEKLEGKIPTMKEKFDLNQDDYRKLRSLRNLPISDQEKTNLLIQQLYNDVTNCATSTDKRLDIMFLQAVSTFTIDVNIINNPDGAAFDIVDLLLDTSPNPKQKRTVATVWSDPASDPFKDIEEVVSFAKMIGRSFKEIWIEWETWNVMKNRSAVKSAISGYQNPGSNKNFIVRLDSVNEYLVATGCPPLRIINERRMVEKDGKETLVSPFKKENLVFIPDGKLGIVHNAIAIDDWERNPMINYAKYDRTLVMKWQDNDPWREYTACELNAFPALEGIDGIYLLQTDIATA